MHKTPCTAIILLVLTLATMAPPALADDAFIGKVVSVADGDTITVLVDQTQHRIRLYGIDAPERRQDFSLIETAKANGLELFSYLRYVFEKLPLMQTLDEYRSLLPQYVDRCSVDAPARWRWGLFIGYPAIPVERA